MTGVTASGLQPCSSWWHRLWHMTLRVALGGDKRQGDRLGTSSSGVGRGNHTMNTQWNLILGVYSRLLRQLPCCATGSLGMGPEPRGSARRCCQHAGKQKHPCSYWLD